jgi:hypothetical protein
MDPLEIQKLHDTRRQRRPIFWSGFVLILSGSFIQALKPTLSPSQKVAVDFMCLFGSLLSLITWYDVMRGIPNLPPPTPALPAPAYPPS